MPVLNIEDYNDQITGVLETEIMNFLDVFGKFTIPTLVEGQTSFTATDANGFKYTVGVTELVDDAEQNVGWAVTSVSVSKTLSVLVDDNGTTDDTTDDVYEAEDELVYSISGLSLNTTLSAADKKLAMQALAWTINGTSDADKSVSTLVPSPTTAYTTWNLGAGNDVLTGSNGIDRIEGGLGNDILNGLGGNDTIDGGSGLDQLLGGAGNDYLITGSSTDTTANTANGESGNDRVSGGAGAEILHGGNGNDYVDGNAGNDTLYGGTGMAESQETVGTTLLLGKDTLTGDAGDDKLFGLIGDDVLLGGVGNDRLEGGIGNDRLSGDAGNDVMYGEAGIDRLIGGSGNDRLIGGGDRDILAGSAGNDSLYGNSGNDTLSDTDGDDYMNGGTGNDILRGGAGKDTLVGGGNSDKLYGGAGGDTMTGGSGADQFIFSTKSELGKGDAGRDVITDYRDGSGDVIRLSALNLDLKTDGKYYGSADGRSFGEVYFHEDTQTLRIDANGDKRTDYEIRIDVDGNLDTYDGLTLNELNLIV